MTVTRVFLTGFMGSGKTTVGQMLARALQWRFIDLDQHIEKNRDKASAIFSAPGGKRPSGKWSTRPSSK
ncbi:shikimate kinase [Geofilum rubicundum]|uniref:Shikimate kinase I n=1 Tax=Geofilum rubicundum JCM 15548 TaxID=1236989 RepID=A0A0E9LUJ4_9BACT|nr:shikimate kinase [Geofilum rubicundum]GAO29262.1 hypothetical protein JCM15548_11430 [Geofilum rubicundum JCM 15548]